MQKAKHIVIIAGEESGDIHAAELITQLKKNNPLIHISGIGGKHMEKAGAQLISDLARYGVTGFTEALRYLPILRQAFSQLKTHLSQTKPDLVILVDYPGFNLRVAKYAKEIGLKVFYYISPQIWAWKAKRIHFIKKYIDKMAVILPFEKILYQQAGIPVQFVGHPLVKKVALVKDSIIYRKELALPLTKPIIALLPGSRLHEIERHMPVLLDTIRLLLKKVPDFHFVMPIAETINPQQIKSYFDKKQFPITFVLGQAIACMAAADMVVVASGTASLECALLAKPMCILYKSSLLTYIVAMQLIKVKFLGLCNLLMNKMLVPEFLQYDCNAQELSQYLLWLYQDTNRSSHMVEQMKILKEQLSSDQADCTLMESVLNEIC